MHMLFIVRCDPFKSSSGTEIFAGNLALELAKEGHKVKFIHERQSSGEAVAGSVDGIEAHGLHLIGMPYLRGFHYRSKCAKVCINLIRESKVDAVISFGAGTFAGHIFKRIKGLAKRPVLVYYAVDSMVAEYERSKPTILKRGIIRRLKAWIWYNALIRSDKLSCGVADFVIASSKDTVDSIVKDYHATLDKVKVVYFGLPDDYAEGFEIHDSETPIFLHISTVPERKGTLYFLEALKQLEEVYGVRARGIIVGTNDPFYTDLAKALKVDVEFTGKIPNHEVKKYYASCTALVSPSLSEGFCLPVVEAMMFGKPTIASKVGSLPELIEDGIDGFLVTPRDSSYIAERMYTIVSQGRLRKNMSIGCRKKAERFKISNVTRVLIRLLD